MSGLSTHVLDTALGRPAAGVEVRLDAREGEGWRALAHARTNDDGRVPRLLPEGEALRAQTYRLVFATGDYHAARGVEGFFPEVAIAFIVRDPALHHHVPLLLAPHGYSTYRGS
jgi:5-hydroxyisourate hydrolase